jgi:hypothetical protein
MTYLPLKSVRKNRLIVITECSSTTEFVITEFYCINKSLESKALRSVNSIQHVELVTGELYSLLDFTET